MKGFRKVKLNDITVNLDKIRIPLSSYERSKLEKNILTMVRKEL